MKNVLVLLIHLLTVVAKLLGPGGIKGIIAEHLLLKEQLLVVCRPPAACAESVTVRPSGIWLVFTVSAARPYSKLRFHDYLVRRKYRALYSPHHRGKPGPKGPTQELIRAIVELKRRKPRFGYPRIARIISNTLGIERLTETWCGVFSPSITTQKTRVTDLLGSPLSAI